MNETLTYSDEDDSKQVEEIKPVSRKGMKMQRTQRQIEASRANLQKRVSKGGRPKKVVEQEPVVEIPVGNPIVKLSASDWLKQWVEEPDEPVKVEKVEPVKPSKPDKIKAIESMLDERFGKVLSRFDDIAPHVVKASKYSDRIYHMKVNKPPKETKSNKNPFSGYCTILKS